MQPGRPADIPRHCRNDTRRACLCPSGAWQPRTLVPGRRRPEATKRPGNHLAFRTGAALPRRACYNPPLPGPWTRLR
jgi:hypothetical protein